MAKVSILSKDVNLRGREFSIRPGDEITIDDSQVDDTVRELIRRGRIIITKGSVKGIKKIKIKDEELKLAEGDATLKPEELKIFLDQNANTVIKALKEAKLTKTDIINLRIFEAGNLRRRKVLIALNAMASGSEEESIKEPDEEPEEPDEKVVEDGSEN